MFVDITEAISGGTSMFTQDPCCGRSLAESEFIARLASDPCCLNPKPDRVVSPIRSQGLRGPLCLNLAACHRRINGSGHVSGSRVEDFNCYGSIRRASRDRTFEARFIPAVDLCVNPSCSAAIIEADKWGAALTRTLLRQTVVETAVEFVLVPRERRFDLLVAREGSVECRR